MGNEIASDAPLTASQRQSFDIVLAMIVPASPDGGKPSATEVDVLGYIRAHEGESLAGLGAELDRLDAEAQARYSEAFAALAAERRQALVDSLRSQDARFLRNLALQTVTCYYGDDRVLQAYGLEARPPLPKGYDVPAGDLTLLEPVRRRGRIYRAAD